MLKQPFHAELPADSMCSLALHSAFDHFICS